MPTQTYRVFKLRFPGGLHLAKGKSEYDQSDTILHSDTLKSALFVCALQLFGEKTIQSSFLDYFTLSSAYPFFRSEFFFPKPMASLPQLEGIEQEKQGKRLKKVQYFGKSYFEQLLAGSADVMQAAHLHDGDKYVSDHEHLVGEKSITIVRSSVQQRVTIPYDFTEDPTPYYVDRLFFGEEAGLFFLLDCSNEVVCQQVKASLALLGDNGIGTDKTVGNGYFTFEESELLLQVPERATHQLCLSLYCPAEEELNEQVLSNSSYNLIKRGGYLANPQNVENIRLRKRSVYMFTEGSVFPRSHPLRGKLVDLKPEIPLVTHPVWRDGRALFLPILPLSDDLH